MEIELFKVGDKVSAGGFTATIVELRGDDYLVVGVVFDLDKDKPNPPITYWKLESVKKLGTEIKKIEPEELLYSFNKAFCDAMREDLLVRKKEIDLMADSSNNRRLFLCSENLWE